MMRHKSLHSQKFAEKRRKKRQALVFLVLLCLLTVSASGILLMRASFFQIKTVAVEGSKLVPPETLSAAALKSLSGSYLKIIPFSNSLFYSKKAINTTLESDFKEVKDVTVRRDGLSGLRLTVVERTPAAVVCAGFRDDANPDECYLSDEHGYVFAALASSTTQGMFVSDNLNHYYLPTTQGAVTPGQNFLPEDRFKALQTFAIGAAHGGLSSLGILIGENGQYEMYVKNKKGDSEVTIYFDDRSPFEKTLENLLTFWQNADTSIQATTTPSFNYINLRFGNAVYYSTQ